jgi:hypothetical protein
MKTIIAIMAAAGTAASADITINEVLGSTSGADNEFVELYNTGGSAVDLTGWTIELWDSDAGDLGGADGGSPYALSGSIAAGGYFTIANALAESAYGFTADQNFDNNSIENSSYTIALRDAMDNLIEAIFVTDGGDGDTANIAGTPITPDLSFGPDGTFLPAGFYRVGDGNDQLALLEFGQPSPSATPGAMNIPAPAALAALGMGGLLAGRRRR